MDRTAFAARLATTGTMAALDLLCLLAKKGLVSPDEVEVFSESITQHFRMSVDKSAEFQKLGDVIENMISEPLADAKALAISNWTGE